MSARLDSVVALLRKTMGLDPDVMGRKTMRGLVEGQMRVEGLEDGRLYADLLSSSPPHFQRLIDAVVVTESWFFREPEALARVVEMAGKPRATTFRVLCLPCAGGEEAYSLAISLMEAGLDDFTITACDISSQALTKAREAIYGRYSFRGSRPDERSAYFEPLERGRYQVRPAVRGRVRFRLANVMDGLGQLESSYHVIICRHLLIYLTPDARRAALGMFQEKLAPGGELMVAACEMPTLLLPEWSGASEGTSALKPLVGSSTLVKTASFPAWPNPAKLEPNRLQQAPTASQEPLRPAENGTTGANSEGLSSDRTPPSDRAFSPDRSPSAASDPELTLARQQADEGNLDEAARHCEESLRRQPSSQAYLLMGAIKAAQGEHDQAQTMVRRAVYLDPRDVDALRYLAVYAERDGRRDVAQGLRYRAARAEREQARQTAETHLERSS